MHYAKKIYQVFILIGFIKINVTPLTYFFCRVKLAA